MPHESPAPRRHRSSFRPPAADSVDPATLNRLFGDDAFEASLHAPAEEPTHPDDRARHRRVADRAAEHLAARIARANDRAGHRPVVAPMDTPTTSRPLAEPVERPALAAPQPAPASAAAQPAPASAAPQPAPVFDAGGAEVAFDDLITPQTFDAPGLPGAALARDVAPVDNVAPARDVPPMHDVTRVHDMAPAHDAATLRAVTAARDAEDPLAAIDPEGLLEPSDEPAAPAAPPRRRPERARARSRRVADRRVADRRVVVVSAAAAVLVAGGIGVAIAGVTSSAPPAPGSTSSSESRDAVDAEPTATITGDLSETAAPFTGGTTVSVAGEHLDEVAKVSVGGTEAAIVDATADRLTFTVPPAADDALGEVPVVFSDAQGNPATEPTGTGSLSLTYTNDPGIDAQLDYVSEHWNAYNPDYPTLPGQDSVNFASQSLVARGWSMDDVWNADGEAGTMSAAWSGSTALRDYLRTRTDRATELSDAQRDDVKAGDIAQFDWDDSGDRDFTAVVTRVERTDAGTKVWVTAHSKDVEAWDVDSALASGGTVTYFSIR